MYNPASPACNKRAAGGVLLPRLTNTHQTLCMACFITTHSAAGNSSQIQVLSINPKHEFLSFWGTTVWEWQGLVKAPGPIDPSKELSRCGNCLHPQGREARAKVWGHKKWELSPSGMLSMFFTPGQLPGRTEPFFRGCVRGRAEAGTLACYHQTHAVDCT